MRVNADAAGCRPRLEGLSLGLGLRGSPNACLTDEGRKLITKGFN